MQLQELNELPDDLARAELLPCCGSERWARAMVARRPFASLEQLQAAADEEWWKLERRDWIEAFSHHPRIGDRMKARGWASLEQAGASAASVGALKELAHLNGVYEKKFGFVFLIFATGKTGDEMLEALRMRLFNPADVELKNAGGEQAKITRLRLEKLVT